MRIRLVTPTSPDQWHGSRHDQHTTNASRCGQQETRPGSLASLSRRLVAAALGRGRRLRARILGGRRPLPLAGHAPDS